MSLPWFPCYPKDLLGSLRWQMMSAEERGGYWQLLCLCYASANGKIHATVEELSRLAAIDLESHPRVLESFHQDENGEWYNERAYSEWVKQQNKQKSRVAAGKAGAAGRWQKDGKRIGKRNADAMASSTTRVLETKPSVSEALFPEIPSDPSLSSSPDSESLEELYRWGELVAIYPKHRMKPDTRGRSEWKKLTRARTKRDAVVDEILAGVRECLESQQWSEGAIPNIGKFLRDGMWQAPPPRARVRPGRQSQIEANNRAVHESLMRQVHEEVTYES